MVRLVALKRVDGECETVRYRAVRLASDQRRVDSGPLRMGTDGAWAGHLLLIPGDVVVALEGVPMGSCLPLPSGQAIRELGKGQASKVDVAYWVMGGASAALLATESASMGDSLDTTAG